MDNVEKLDALAARVEREWSRCAARRDTPACWEAAVNCGAMDLQGNIIDLTLASDRLLESMLYHAKEPALLYCLGAETDRRREAYFESITQNLEAAAASLARSLELDNSVSELGKLL